MHSVPAIQKALDLVEERLKEPLRVGGLARLVGMSLWHFQRTFTAMVGEPAGSYLRRRRLTEAGRCLATTERRILDVALEYQFESHEAFTRAFKTEMTVSPSEWRSGQIPAGAGLPRLHLTATALAERYRHMKLIPEIVTLSSRAFIGMRSRFVAPDSPAANNMDVIPKLWNDFLTRIHEVPSIEPNITYGLSDVPSALGEPASHADEVIYLAAVPVAPEAVPPSGMVKWTSHEGTYAKFIHRGPVSKLGETFGFIYGKWLPSGEADRAAGPDIERIDARFHPHRDDSILEIFIPVAVKSRAGTV